jgi:hypothetical protein
MRIGIYLSACLLLLLVAILSDRASRRQTARPPGSLQVVLVGASIGQAWRLAEWSDRVGEPRLSAESVAIWQFDKSEAIDEILMRPGIKFRVGRAYLRALWRPPQKPDLVILKECSAYFPGDVTQYQSLVQKWVAQLVDHEIKAVLATVVPVTRKRAARERGKQEALVAFNQWIRNYAAEHRLTVLDLEAVLRSPGPERYLREEFAIEDGSHLNSSAYAVLDQSLRSLLRPTPAGAAN